MTGAVATATNRRAGTRRRERGGDRPQVLQLRVWSELFARHDLLTSASGIAFRSVVALVPLVLLAFAILGATGEQRLWTEQLGPAIRPRMLPGVYAGIDAAVRRIFADESPVLLVFAAGLAVWDVSSAVRAVMGSFAKVYEQEERRTTVRRFAVSLAIAVPFSVGVIGSLLLVTLLPKAADGGAGVLLTVASWIVALAALSASLWLLLRLGPPQGRRVAWVGVGAGLVVMGWIVQSALFRIFVVDIASFRSATGTLAVFLVLTTYLYVAAIVLLVGIELDELLREGEAPRALWEALPALRRR
jgi:membrane protein